MRLTQTHAMMEINENEKNVNDKGERILSEGIKKLALSCVVYFIGYMNWSLTWILVPVILSILNDERKRKGKKRRYLNRRIAMGYEKEVILENYINLPAWVYFPDIERTEWLNKIIKQLWPNINQFAQDLLQESVEGVLRHNLEKYSLKSFKFERIELGNVPFRIGGAIVYDNVSRDEIVMDLDVSYAGDCDIKFSLRGLPNGGIRNFQLNGRLRVVLKPLIKTIPLAGGLEVFFLNKPDIDFDLDGIAGILEIPGINDLLKKSIVATVSSMMVLPNKYPIRLSSEVSSAQLKTPSPAGVLRVHVVEAKQLVRKDISFTGKGKSDPYATLLVGEQDYRTETIDSSLTPKWDYWCEFIVTEFNGQKLYIHVWDEDPTDDESLGRTSLEISNLIKAGRSDLWLDLDDVKHGKIHIRTTWLSLSTDYLDLQAALYETQQLRLNHMNTSLLTVFVDSATNLPQVKPSTKPNPYVQIQLGKQIKTTKISQRTVNPVWEQGFSFFVSNPDSDCLWLKILDKKTDSELGGLCYNVSNLSRKENLEIIKQPFKLEKLGYDCKLVWSLHLKIFKNENSEELKLSTSSDSSKPPLEKQESSFSLWSNSSASDEVFDRVSRASTRSNMSTASFAKNLTESSGDRFLGQIYVTLRYSAQRQRLIVVVHSLSNMQCHTEDKDIYVKLYLLPDRKKDTKRKTDVKNCFNPTFDETFEYLISQGDLSSKQLEVSVVEERMMKNYVVGMVIIDLEKYDLFTSHTGWFDLGPHIKNE